MHTIMFSTFFFSIFSIISHDTLEKIPKKKHVKCVHKNHQQVL